MKTPKCFIYEILGWYGAIAMLSAYGLVSYNIVSPTGIFFQALNITGVIGMIPISYEKKLFQSVVLNIFWGIIGLGVLIRIFI